MAALFSAFHNFFSLFILFLHLGCFTVKSKNQPSKKLKLSPATPSSSPTRRILASSLSYLKRAFSPKPNSNSQSPVPTLTSARSSHQSIATMAPPEDEDQLLDVIPQPDIAPNYIFPCTICGEIFQNPQLLEQHRAIKHAVTELSDGDTGRNIVYIIFKSGWSCKEKNPEIHRILKIHNSPKILSRFEEYREAVKSKSARIAGDRGRDERCIADGNELLRFYCSTFTCDLGQNGNSNICEQHYCNICGIIRSGFSGKMDGISMQASSYRAHVAVPEGIEEEFEYLNVKRAMLVCRVVAGRVGCEDEMMEKENGGYDSVVGRNGINGEVDEEELIVFNPRAVLPCFVIVYTA